MSIGLPPRLFRVEGDRESVDRLAAVLLCSTPLADPTARAAEQQRPGGGRQEPDAAKPAAEPAARRESSCTAPASTTTGPRHHLLGPVECALSGSDDLHVIGSALKRFLRTAGPALLPLAGSRLHPFLLAAGRLDLPAGGAAAAARAVMAGCSADSRAVRRHCLRLASSLLRLLTASALLLHCLFFCCLTASALLPHCHCLASHTASALLPHCL